MNALRIDAVIFEWANLMSTRRASRHSFPPKIKDCSMVGHKINGAELPS